MGRIGHAAFLVAVLASGGVAPQAFAAPVFLGVSTVGLEPPPGFVPKGDLFQKGRAAIDALGLSGAGYLRAEADRASVAAAFAGPSATIEAFSANGKHGFIMRGRKSIAGVDVRVWVVLLGNAAQGTVARATVPVADTNVTDAVIVAAFRTIAFRDRPGLDAQIAALGFVVDDAAGFRPVAASAETKTLDLDDVGAEAASVPHVRVHGDPMVVPPNPDAASRYAEQFLHAADRGQPIRISDRRLFDVRDAHYAEVHAEKGSDTVSTDIVFYVRYDEGGATEISCSAPHPMSRALAARCRMLALSVRPRA